MDNTLVLEHSLREHVRIQVERFDAFVNEVGKAWTAEVSYEHDKGGRWTVSTYSGGSTLYTRGSELVLVMDEHIATLRRREGLTVLRSLIAGPSHAA
jgi:hypothetical protein